MPSQGAQNAGDDIHDDLLTTTLEQTRKITDLERQLDYWKEKVSHKSLSYN